MWEAYTKVRAKQGAAGVEEPSSAACDKRGPDHLDKIWNRMAAGRDVPPPVRTVKIPKANGGERSLGIPTVSDRIAQTVVQVRWEPAGDPRVPPDASGYRPGQSALEAVGQARQRYGTRAWVLDLAIQGCFDTSDHALRMRAVQKHAQDTWVVRSIERWLNAPAQEEEGHVTAREKGTPQGGVRSPLRANLVLHDACDEWMQRTSPQLPCERDAEEASVHGRTEAEAQEVGAARAARLQACRLELHPETTQIVSGKDDERRGTYPNEPFDVLGETFRPRRSKHRWGKSCIHVSPAVADHAGKAMRAEIRDWKRPLRSDKSLAALSRMCNPQLRGWLH